MTRMSLTPISCCYVGALTGSRLAAAGIGKVIGVFQHGWYIGDQSSVWLLHNSNAGKVPFGIGIRDFERKFPYYKAVEGSRISWSNDLLLIPKAGLTIQLCSPEPLCKPTDVHLSQLQKALSFAEKALSVNGRGDLRNLLNRRSHIFGFEESANNFSDLSLSYMEARLSLFFSALRQNNTQALEQALKKMIGLGLGLTPSMDDWLVGFLYTAVRMSPRMSLQEDLFRIVISTSPNRTTRISAAYLLAAASGEPFEALERALFAQQPDDMDRLLKIGSSSGSDMLTGMAFAASYYAESRIESTL